MSYLDQLNQYSDSLNSQHEQMTASLNAGREQLQNEFNAQFKDTIERMNMVGGIAATTGVGIMGVKKAYKGLRAWNASRASKNPDAKAPTEGESGESGAVGEGEGGSGGDALGESVGRSTEGQVGETAELGGELEEGDFENVATSAGATAPPRTEGLQGGDEGGFDSGQADVGQGILDDLKANLGAEGGESSAPISGVATSAADAEIGGSTGNVSFTPEGLFPDAQGGIGLGQYDAGTSLTEALGGQSEVADAFTGGARSITASGGGGGVGTASGANIAGTGADADLEFSGQAGRSVGTGTTISTDPATNPFNPQGIKPQSSLKEGDLGPDGQRISTDLPSAEVEVGDTPLVKPSTELGPEPDLLPSEAPQAPVARSGGTESAPTYAEPETAGTGPSVEMGETGANSAGMTHGAPMGPENRPLGDPQSEPLDTGGGPGEVSGPIETGDAEVGAVGDIQPGVGGIVSGGVEETAEKGAGFLADLTAGGVGEAALSVLGPLGDLVGAGFLVAGLVKDLTHHPQQTPQDLAGAVSGKIGFDPNAIETGMSGSGGVGTT